MHPTTCKLSRYMLHCSARTLGADPDRPYCQVYTFQLGDTLKSVAELFDTTEAELTQLNSGGWDPQSAFSKYESRLCMLPPS